MKRKSYNPNGSKIKAYANEHLVAVWLREAGYNKLFLCKYLNVTFKRLPRALLKPHECFTLSQLILIAGLIQRPFIDVFFALFPCHLFKKEFIGKWYDNTGLSVEFIPDAPES